MEHWGPVISFLLAVISILMGVVVNQNKKLGDKLDAKVDESTCGERRSACSPKLEREDAELWAAFSGHSHTSLPADARVIR
jgi:hypothetical protein